MLKLLAILSFLSELRAFGRSDYAPLPKTSLNHVRNGKHLGKTLSKTLLSCFQILIKSFVEMLKRNAQNLRNHL